MTVRLLVMRHAKASYPEGVADHDRPLSARGERDAKAAADWLAQHSGPVDLALVSDAVRTRQTWEALAAAWAGAPNATVEPGLYLASANRIMRTVLARAEVDRAVLLIAHNPGVHDVVLRATRPGNQMQDRFPTSAIAVLRAPSWSEWRLAEFEAGVVPRG